MAASNMIMLHYLACIAFRLTCIPGPRGEGQISVELIHFGQLIYRDVSRFLYLPLSFFSFPFSLGWMCMYFCMGVGCIVAFLRNDLWWFFLYETTTIVWFESSSHGLAVSGLTSISIT